MKQIFKKERRKKSKRTGIDRSCWWARGSVFGPAYVVFRICTTFSSRHFFQLSVLIVFYLPAAGRVLYPNPSVYFPC